MRRIPAFFAALCLFFLSGCARQSPRALWRQVRTFYGEASAVVLRADVSADYGGTVFAFTLRYTGGGESGRLEVLAPESVAGLGADVSLADGVTLSFDGAELYTGALSPDGLSPVDCIPIMLAQWRGGYLTGVGCDSVQGTDALEADFRVEDDVTLRTWFDRETWLPLAAEFISGTKSVIVCTFTEASVSADGSLKNSAESID